MSLTRLARVVPLAVISVSFNEKVLLTAHAGELRVLEEVTVGQLAAQPPLPTLTHEPAVTRLPLWL